MTTSSNEFLGELRLGRRLATRGQVAAGGLAILAGLLFLLAGPALALVGLWAALAGVLAGIVLGLTLLSVVELLGGSGERGGTYVLIHETIGGLGAFLAGWSILAGSAGLGVMLVRAAASHLLLLFPTFRLQATDIALGLLGLLILAELLQITPRRVLLWPAMVLLLTALAFVVLSALPRLDLGLYRSGPAVGLGQLMRSAAWLVAGYAAFESLLASRRQIRDPGHDLAPALFGALIFGGLAFGIIMFLTPGRERRGATRVRCADAGSGQGQFPALVGTPVAGCDCPAPGVERLPDGGGSTDARSQPRWGLAGRPGPHSRPLSHAAAAVRRAGRAHNPVDPLGADAVAD